MAANEDKQRIRLAKIFSRLAKVTYTGLTNEEKLFILANKEKEHFDKCLYGARGFYAKCKRLENNSVDWDALTVEELYYFDFINKGHQKACSKLDKIIEKYRFSETKQNEILHKFKLINLKFATSY